VTRKVVGVQCFFNRPGQKGASAEQKNREN
jgi:hypothetical protein